MCLVIPKGDAMTRLVLSASFAFACYMEKIDPQGKIFIF
jgi:hypothetical protein